VKRVKVTVPASTSNLGPAFDCLGLALALHNELTVTLYDEPGEPAIEIEGEGADQLSRGEDNVVLKSMRTVLAGRTAGRLELRCLNRIPLARGLGSSAAAAVAGLFAANALLDDNQLTREQLLEYATAMEGHPDNVAPAIYGGLVASARAKDAWRSFPLKPHKDLRAAVCIPSFELSTAKARSVLPDTYLRADAVDNAGRAAILSTALERGLWERLPLAMEDRLHQPYRAPLIPGFNAVLRAAREAGCGAALSGAGPAMLALGAPETLEAAGKAMVAAFAAHGVASGFLILPVDKKGVAVTTVKSHERRLDHA
jgi:homoserine kinase